MNRKSVILTIFSLLTLIIAVVVIFVSLNAGEFWLIKQGNKNKATTSENNLIGGQRDQYGCLIAAGYSWCEGKQKCLRVWEEPCSTEEALKNYLRDNISSLSPEKEVLGGKFYITKLEIKSPVLAEVGYEDGHIALIAQFNYSLKGGQFKITNFKVLHGPTND